MNIPEQTHRQHRNYYHANPCADMTAAQLADLAHAVALTVAELQLLAYVPSRAVSCPCWGEAAAQHAIHSGGDGDWERRALALTPLAAGSSLGADLTNANLQGALLVGVSLPGARFWHADLRGVNFARADLRWASFWAADLSGGNLAGADLRGASFWAANLRHVEYTALTVWPAGFEPQRYGALCVA